MVNKIASVSYKMARFSNIGKMNASSITESRHFLASSGFSSLMYKTALLYVKRFCSTVSTGSLKFI